MAIIHAIINQHAEEASFLWNLRDAAVNAPHYSLDDLIELDNRVEAHIDGLRIAGDEGWEICKKNLAFEDPGEVFVAANLALESRDPQRMADVLDFVSAVPDTLPGVISAFGWVSPEHLRGKVKDLLGAESPVLRHIGLAACIIHRVDPGNYLVDAIESDDLRLRARGLRGAGELNRLDLLPVVRDSLSDSEIDCRYWAAWSASLLGKTKPVKVLQGFVESGSKYEVPSQQVLVRCLNLVEAQSWLKHLAPNPERIRSLILGSGITGNVAYIPWLINQMQVAENARVAGEAFSLMTGVDLADQDLEGEWPEGFSPGPTENPDDEDVEMDTDEDLPMPDAKLIEHWWGEHGKNFQPNRRYLCGNPVSIEHCRNLLRSGYQRQRIAAALELALLGRDEILFETRAPGFRQKSLLG